MDISSINAGTLPAAPNSRQDAGVDAKIQSLEQKLQQLNAERKEAVQRKEVKEKEKIDKEIREIEKQIEQLKRQVKKGEEPASAAGVKEQTRAQRPEGDVQGRFLTPAMDEYVPEER